MYNPPDKYQTDDGPTELWKQMHADSLVVVLNDGETFSDISGCSIFGVPSDWDTSQIEDALRNNQAYCFVKNLGDFKVLEVLSMLVMKQWKRQS
jgi:hypothetical protein